MTPNALWIIAAMLAQGALALAILLYLGFIRVPMVMSGKVRMKDIAVDRGGWPERAQLVSNSFDNQFQLPVLFYVAGFVAISFGATLLEVLLALAFVASRYVHAGVHVTTNNVPQRFGAYAIGFGLLCLLWLDLLVRLAFAAFGA